MSQEKSIRADSIVAFDVHVHIEHQGQDSPTDQATKKYFGDSGADRSPEALAEYYRSRNMACVVFTVDENVTGRPLASNDYVAEFAARNSDMPIAFASFNRNT